MRSYVWLHFGQIIIGTYTSWILPPIIITVPKVWDAQKSHGKLGVRFMQTVNALASLHISLVWVQNLI